MIVKFLKSHDVYSAGQSAGFTDIVGNKLIALGIAEKVVPVEPAPTKREIATNKVVKK